MEKIPTIDTLTELSIDFNRLSVIPSFPKLKILIANNNKIWKLGNLPEIEIAHLFNNYLNGFYEPTIKKLLIYNNPLKKIGSAYDLTDLEASNTLLRKIPLYPKMQHLTLYNCYLTSIPISTLFLQSITELHIDFIVYYSIIDDIRDKVSKVTFQINEKKLDRYISKLQNRQDEVKSIIMGLEFKTHEYMIKKSVDNKESYKLISGLYYKVIQIYLELKN